MSEKVRVAWVDYAKGLCIFFVVMLHCNKVVEEQAQLTGWMHHVVEFARPFRMPDFFMISGLFLARTIDRPWRGYIDKKVVHFAYFFIMWVTIEGVFKSIRTTGGLHLDRSNIQAIPYTLIQPLGTPLWFIYILPPFYVLTRLVKRVPWPIVWVIAAGLQVAHIEIGVMLVDAGCERFVFFYSGYVFAPKIFKLADWFMAHPAWGAAGLIVWGLVNGTLVSKGVAGDPGVSLLLGCAGALAVIMVSALLSRSEFMSPLRDWGQRSIVVYLAFFVPMILTQKALFKLNLISDVGSIAVVVTLAAVLVPLVFHRLVAKTPLRFLFERPSWAYIVPPKPAPTTESSPTAESSPTTKPPLGGESTPAAEPAES